MTKEEAINEIRSWDFLSIKEIDAIQTLIPELRESDDERIRKWLINYFDSIKTVWNRMGITCEQILSWLEKQQEQKLMNQEGLEEEIGAYFKDWYVDESDQGYSLKTPTGSAVMGHMKNVARHFAKWGSEQILREVEQWVEKNTCRYIYTQNDGEGYITDVFLENPFVDDLKKAMKEIFTQWGAKNAK